MFKKAFAAIAVAGLLVLGGAGAASADYPTDVPGTVSDTTPVVGQPVTITFSELGDLEVVFFSVTPSTGATLASIVLASGGGSVQKPVTDGSASATFTAQTAGTYVVSVSDGETTIGSVTLDVAAAGSGSGGGSGELPATGGTVPAAYIWLGVGAIGLGGIAVAAAVARRRAAGTR